MINNISQKAYQFKVNVQKLIDQFEEEFPHHYIHSIDLMTEETETFKGAFVRRYIDLDIKLITTELT